MTYTEKIIRKPAVLELTGVSDATLDREEKAGRFPKRRRIGIRAVGWLESEVQEWIAKRGQAQPNEMDS